MKTVIRVGTLDASIIGPYPKDKLEKLLRFRVPDYEYTWEAKNRGWDGYEPLMSGNQFPSGLLWKIKSFLRDQGVDFTVKDHREQFKHIREYELPGIDYYPFQTEAVEAALLYQRGIIKLPTSSGKTLIAAGILKGFNSGGAFIVHTTECFDQTYKLFKKVLPGMDIGRCGGPHREIGDITIFMVQTLLSLIDKQADISFLNKFRVLIIDETHHVPSIAQGKRKKKVLKGFKNKTSWFIAQRYFKNADARIGLSATVRQKGPGLLLVGACGPILYTKSLKQLQDEGYVSKAYIKFLRMEGPLLTPGLKYHEAYDFGIVDNFPRNRRAVELAVKYAKDGKLVFLFVERILHGQILQDLFEGEGTRVEFLSGEVEEGESDTDRRLRIRKHVEAAKRREVSIIVATRQLFGEGADIPTMDVLINCAGLKGMHAVPQLLGRGLRLDAEKSNLIYLDFYDRTHAYLEQHAQRRVEIFRELEQEVFIEKRKGKKQWKGFSGL